MYRHILVPTDGSPLSLKAVKAASKLAKELDAKVTALFVIPPYSPPAAGDGMTYYTEGYNEDDYERTMRGYANEALSKVEEAFSESDVECKAVTVMDKTPWQAIVKNAKSRKCDLIVMASHGRRGLASLLLGSETTKVLTHSKTPVLVCR